VKLSLIGARCWQCEKSFEEERLTQCPTCHKYFCEDHRHSMSGRPFCSKGCAEYFFFSEEDSEGGYDE